MVVWLCSNRGVIFPVVKAGQKQLGFYFFFKCKYWLCYEAEFITPVSISHVENFHKLNNLLDIVFKEEEFWQIKLRGILYISLALIVF